MAELYIGLMSGTSADGIDAVLLEISSSGMELKGHIERPHPQPLRREILALCQPGDNEIERSGQMDCQLGNAFSKAVNQLLQQQQLAPADITAIGSHGQTIRHHPPGSLAHPFTLQIGDPNIIAEQTGITTVGDFRRRDIAAGGQGAPLVPAFHRAAFGSSKPRVIVNIGGMANITHLQADNTQGFDTGPGNVLLDGWVERHQGVRFDNCGEWAASGQVNNTLLDRLLQHDYLKRTPPKSTGRETFHLHWLDQQLQDLTELDPADVQATLLEFTAATISQAINQRDCEAIFICGGGACNTQLMTRLQALNHAPVASTQALGINPQQVEAAAFAWLAHQTLKQRSGNCPEATGAKREVILGGIYLAG